MECDTALLICGDIIKERMTNGQLGRNDSPVRGPESDIVWLLLR